MYLTNKIKEITFVPISLFVSSIFWPSILIFSVFLFTLRYFVQKLLNIVYGNGEYTLAGGIDALFQYDKTSGSSAIMHSVLVIKGEPNVEKIRQRCRDVLFKFCESSDKNKNQTNNNNNNGCNYVSSGNDKPLYVQSLQRLFTSKFGFACWKNASRTFNLNHHIRILEGLEPLFPNDKSHVITEDKLLCLLSDLMSEGVMFKNTRPQWEGLIIPNYYVENSPYPHFAMIIRVHHAFADGASFGILLDSVFTENPIKFALNPLKPFPGSSPLKDGLMHLKAMLFGPWAFLMTLKEQFTDKSDLIMPNGYSNKKHVNWSEPIEMNFLKDIRVNSGTSVAAILLTAISGAVRKLHMKGALKKVHKTFNVANMSIMLPYKSRQIQNNFTTFNLACPLDNSEFGGDLLKKLVKTDRISREVSYSCEPTFNFFVMRFAGYLPRFLQTILSDLAGTPVTFSNVPGATSPFSAFGGEVVDAGAWLPLIKSYGLAISTYSYCDKMRLCISTDSWLLEKKADLKWFQEQVDIELKNIAKSCGVEYATKKQCFLAPKIINTNYNNYYEFDRFKQRLS